MDPYAQEEQPQADAHHLSIYSHVRPSRLIGLGKYFAEE